MRKTKAQLIEEHNEVRDRLMKQRDEERWAKVDTEKERDNLKRELEGSQRQLHTAWDVGLKMEARIKELERAIVGMAVGLCAGEDK